MRPESNEKRRCPANVRSLHHFAYDLPVPFVNAVKNAHGYDEVFKRGAGMTEFMKAVKCFHVQADRALARIVC